MNNTGSYLVHDSSTLTLSLEENLIPSRIKFLEGECQIKQYYFLKRNIPKSIFLVFLLIITLFGLIPLKYYAKFRKFVFYQECNAEEATHLYIISSNSNDDIIKITQQQSKPKYFIYKKLKYIMLSPVLVYPVGFNIEQEFNNFINNTKIYMGLTPKQVNDHFQVYGTNQHPVQIPNYFIYLLDVLTEPYFLLQYFFCFCFFLQGYPPLSFALLGVTFLTATANYIMFYLSFKKIKQIAEKTYDVKVVRDGIMTKVKNIELVPGDIYIPEEEIPADSLIVKGDVYVNEANLTGESHPIGKYRINHHKQISKNNVWLYEGAKIVDKTQDARAIIISTNFSTHRGQIIRSILSKRIKDPEVIRSLLALLVEILIVSLIVFFATIGIYSEIEIQPLFIFFKLIDFLASSVPPPLPIFFNMAYGLSLTRLRYHGIIGTEPHKTLEGAQVKNLCFDKTGTLTESKVEIKKIYKLDENSETISQMNLQEQLIKKQRVMWSLFATCHTSKLISEQLLGDEIDKEMFLFSKSKMKKPTDESIKFQIQIEDRAEPVLQVLRINQFESKFRSMSVLVYDRSVHKYYIFVKGAPQKINLQATNSTRKIIEQMKLLSHEGLRTIAIAYRQIQDDELQAYLNLERQQFEKKLRCIGLVAFQNHLKEDTVETISKLKQSSIEPKMITGDNIYIAVQTACRAGIISDDEKILYLEGVNQYEATIRNQKVENKQKKFIGVFFNEKSEEIKIMMKQDEYLSSEYVYAIDNDFFELMEDIFIPKQVKVFARITTENKSQIIKTYKKQDKCRRQKNQSCLSKLIKKGKLKVGMCGDGANDLLALKQADLSIGIQETDASYGSSFTIKKLLDVEQIIRESKCTHSNILDIFQYYISMTMSVLFASIIMMKDATYFSNMQTMYLTFESILLTSILLGISFPSDSPSPTVPNSNSLNRHNHLIIWGHIIIPFTGVLASYLYFFNTEQYMPNPKPQITIQNGFNSTNHSATLVFLMMIIVSPINVFLIYRSAPFKRKIWSNIPLSLLIVLNITLALIFTFQNSRANIKEFFEIQPISITNISICFGIIVGSLTILVIYNMIVNRFRLNETKLEQIEQQGASD